MTQDLLFPIYIALAILFLSVLFLFFQFFRLKRNINSFFRKGEKDLESLLKSLVRKSELQEKNIQEILKKISKLEQISKISFQKIGIVRYNPFKEVGGDQSFSVALLDSENSGFIISSLYMREGIRVFTKPIQKGKSEYSLSEEEQKAIKKAIKS